MPQKLPQIYTVIAYIYIGKVDLQYMFAVIYETCMIFNFVPAPDIGYACTVGTKGLEFDEYKH